MSNWVGPQAPTREDTSPYRRGTARPSQVGAGPLATMPLHLLHRIVATSSGSLRRTFAPRPPPLAIFTSLAVAGTLLIDMIASVTATHISGDLTGSFKGLLLLVVSLPVALMVTIILSVAIPYRAYASPSTPVALAASYCPYALGSLSGIWVALWLGQVLPLGYTRHQPPTGKAMWGWGDRLSGWCLGCFLTTWRRRPTAAESTRGEWKSCESPVTGW